MALSTKGTSRALLTRVNTDCSFLSYYQEGPYPSHATGIPLRRAEIPQHTSRSQQSLTLKSGSIVNSTSFIERFPSGATRKEPITFEDLLDWAINQAVPGAKYKGSDPEF